MSKLRFVAVQLLLLILCSSVFSVDLDFTIDLQHRKFVPLPVSKQGLSQKSADLNNQHIIMQFDRPLTEQDKSRLADDGFELISYIPNLAYVVNLKRPLDDGLMNKHGIRWFGEIYPDDKISKMITDVGLGHWARRSGDRVEFIVVLHKDEDISFWSKEFERLYNAEILAQVRTINAIELVVPELAYLKISEHDVVIWIEQDDPPQEVTNNVARINTRADELQAPPYNLTGNGITVAEWDGGQVDGTHLDLVGRVFAQDGAGYADHATHVAGTVLGTGAQQSGTYRGMAPAALLLSHLWWGSSSEIENEYDNAISFNGATISTNSWGLGVGTPSEANCNSGLGGYVSANATLDEAICGNVGTAPITICWSAGNQRSGGSEYCGSIGWTYHTIGIYGAGKNLITVGAIASGTNEMTSFSSWGPTDDGRIKPDICGPGCSLRSCAVGGGYWNACGTSMSTPATAGTIALMLEALQTAGLPYTTVLPSTVKGILVNTAIDLGLGGFPNGPDYAFGHGKVDGVTAVDKIISGEPSYLENSITTGTSHLYDLTVPSGAGKLKVTLAWDDPGGTGIGGKTLINDLDLELVDAFSSDYQPWVLDPDIPTDGATTGIDRTNNVETVEIDSPTPGLWKARVTGFNVPDGPQAYSLVFTPDSIYTPGNLAALAVFDQSDVTLDPGDSTVVSFWVTNVGAAAEIVDVTISDNNGWLRNGVDSTVSLDPWDSAYFEVVADVTSNSVADDFTAVLCQAQSQIDAQVTSTGTVNVIAGAYYDVALLALPDDTMNSPQQFVVNVIIDNN
ncbi:MAG: S8 family serine peptidase, partial [Candidatus Zixiibacteriota bacterium]